MTSTMTMTTESNESKMTTKTSRANYPFSKTEVADDHCSITFYGKKDATWEQMNGWLETAYGKNGKDKHWKWRGFGTVGTEEFAVVLLRQQCCEYICDPDECERCGKQECGMEENDEGEMVCYECEEESDAE